MIGAFVSGVHSSSVIVGLPQQVAAEPLQQVAVEPLQQVATGPLQQLGVQLSQQVVAGPLQQVTGGSPTVVVLVFLALLVATALSLYLAVRLYRGYRGGGGIGMLVLGTGLVLLTTVPMVLRLVLSNVPIGPVWREVLATAAQLLGLLLILGVVYGRR